MSAADSTIAFASVPYMNAAPLAEFLPQVRAGVEVVYGPPSQLGARLRAGQVDAALVPVADFLADEDLKMIDGLGICADGPVWSVLLKCGRPVGSVWTVGRDGASTTSNALAEILLAEHFGVSVEMVDASSAADAAVVIGDRALIDPPGQFGDVDLAACWKDMTALGFVFAVWAYRADDPRGAEMARIAHEAKDIGCRSIDALAETWATKLNLPEDRCREYLSRVIVYDLGPRQAEGMRVFGEFLAARKAVR